MICDRCKLKGLCRKIRAASREHFRWTLHNLVGHPLSELCARFGLAPIEKRRGSTIYDRHDIDAAINRKKAANLEAAAC